MATIVPARRALFNLYMHVITLPQFLDSREEILPYLTDFDREAYVACLERYVRIPNVFTLWLLEWPGKAAVYEIWPGFTPSYPAHVRTAG